jgi:hypothetical protein
VADYVQIQKGAAEMKAKAIAVDRREIVVVRLAWLLAAGGCLMTLQLLF